MQGNFSPDGAEGPGWGDVTITKMSNLPLGLAADKGPPGRIEVMVSPVISWRKAALWLVDICCHAKGEGVAGNDREGFPAYRAGVCQRSRPETCSRRRENRRLDQELERLERENIFLRCHFWLSMRTSWVRHPPKHPPKSFQVLLTVDPFPINHCIFQSLFQMVEQNLDHLQETEVS